MKDEFILWRGIAVPEDQADREIARIQEQGLSGVNGKRPAPHFHDVDPVRSKLDVWRTKDDLTTHDFMPRISSDDEEYQPGIYGCGTQFGADYYATNHNRTEADNCSIRIKFRGEIQRIIVDPKDFLCNALQDWDIASTTRVDHQTALLRELFGDASSRYFDLARSTDNRQHRAALGNLAAFDPEIVRGHHRNCKIIGGRNGTRFRSSFCVAAPVRAESILDVQRVHRGGDAEPDVTLDEFQGQ